MDIFFFIGSLYSYLGVMRAGRLAREAGVALAWRPFNVRAIMVEQNNMPRNNPVKLKYVWRDLERRAVRHGLGFRPGLPYPVDPDLLANRVAVVAAQEGWCEQYATETYRAWFLEHRAPGDPGRILAKLGKDPQRIVEQANAAEIRRRFDAETDAARKLGIFGAPTFAVGSDIFWGDDRLEDALEWAGKR